MGKIAKIRQEIERRIKELSEAETDYREEGCDSISALLISGISELQKILSFISTLESEEPDKSLEEAAEESGLEYAPIISGEALDLSGQFYETDDVDWPSRCGFIKGFKAGAKWQKQQMIEEAIEGEVYTYDKFSYVKEKNSKSLTELLAKFNDGDKVKIIIVKEK